MSSGVIKLNIKAKLRNQNDTKKVEGGSLRSRTEQTRKKSV